jgi:hypothetical protein
MLQDVAIAFPKHMLSKLLICRIEASFLKKHPKGFGMIRVSMTNHPIHVKNDSFFTHARKGTCSQNLLRIQLRRFLAIPLLKALSFVYLRINSFPTKTG